MKTRILIWAFVVALITNGAMVSTALAGPGFGPWDDEGIMETRMEHRMDRRMDRMAEILDLTEAQQQQIEDLHKQAAEKNAPYREQLAASREKVRQLCDAESIDATAIRTELAAQVDAKTALIVSRATVRSETLKLLTPEQRELAEKLAPRKGGKQHGKHGKQGKGMM
ncbi:MAG: hypothetical protein C0624_11160 [Desulfuromonas sp.]|nr:MAG: hypothetical protein C0624_11160 [Desulfuromonas sp.]